MFLKYFLPTEQPLIRARFELIGPRIPEPAGPTLLEYGGPKYKRVDITLVLTYMKALLESKPTDIVLFICNQNEKRLITTHALFDAMDTRVSDRMGILEISSMSDFTDSFSKHWKRMPLVTIFTDIASLTDDHAPSQVSTTLHMAVALMASRTPSVLVTAHQQDPRPDTPNVFRVSGPLLPHLCRSLVIPRAGGSSGHWKGAALFETEPGVKCFEIVDNAWEEEAEGKDHRHR
eukprot:gnl/Dysnectes_brevis/6096_a9190_374.p1 GENE.gnl/Dysnectes_brevis/6096_a9190_374~~gnl/Dysnectes_brevis/6096_a9190_374.p1  ORF type:complete len:233 (+),score=41.07 gnl/Dysnectes_brevis/6096_a9190_374:92-790(+)